MCIVAAKYFKDVGWVGVKNRDRNYATKIHIVRSNRNRIERLFIDDDLSRYTEGLNEFGVCIISSTLAVKSDEKEGKQARSSGSRRAEDDFKSIDGKKIRTALFAKTAEQAAKMLVESQLVGATLIFDTQRCFVLEAAYNIRKAEAERKSVEREFKHSLKEIKKSDIVVRTNHGIDLRNTGYQFGPTEKAKKKRRSSESRRKIALAGVKLAKEPRDMLVALSQEPNRDTFFNPIRRGNVLKKEMVTTGQLLLISKSRMLGYIRIQSNVTFDALKRNDGESKTNFKLLKLESEKVESFSEWNCYDARVEDLL